MAKKETGGKSKSIRILAPRTARYKKGGKVNLIYAIINAGNALEKSPVITKIEYGYIDSEMTTHRMLSEDEQLSAINRMNRIRFGRLGTADGEKPVRQLDADIHTERTIPALPGKTPVSLELKPITLTGARDDDMATLAIERFENHSLGLFDKLRMGRLKNAIVAGSRDHETGAIIAPVARIDGRPGTVRISVTLGDGTVAFRDVETVEAPEKTDIERRYHAGDGHVHTDYSWLMPNFHTPNGPSTHDRALEALDHGLSWMFLTDYSIQFFSRHSTGGLNHRKNTRENPKAVWEDHVDETDIVESRILEETAEFVLVASQEVPTDLDSHNLVWAKRRQGGDPWERPERVRSEQFDAPFLSVFNLLRFLLGGIYLKSAFTHDPPWSDRDIYMSPYEGYDKAPHAYREHDLVWANGFLQKPFIVAAHPYNNSYRYKGLHLAFNGREWVPMAVSHVKGSALVGFEVFEATMNPAEKPKDEVLAVWNMFLWNELEKSFEQERFLVAFANSDAHLNSFSGQKKFGKTKTFVHLNGKPLTFANLADALERGSCTCTSMGDFATLVMERNGKEHHPGSFVEIANGETISFKVHCKPREQERQVLCVTLQGCTKPPDGADIGNAGKYLDEMYMAMGGNRKTVVNPGESPTSMDILASDAIYPQKCAKADDSRLSCYYAVIAFGRDGKQDGATVTNPIFVKVKPKP